MAFGWLLVLVCMMASGAASGWDEAGPSSRGGRRAAQRRGNRQEVFDTERNDDLELENFEGRVSIREERLDIRAAHSNVGGFVATLQCQGWLTAFSNPPTRVSPMLITQLYFSMERPGSDYVRGKVDSKNLRVSAADIANYLGVPNEGDRTYFEDFSFRDMVPRYIPLFESLGRVVRSGAGDRHTVGIEDLTPMAKMWWQIIRVNVLPQGGPTTSISSFGLYLLWKIISGHMINLPHLMLNHMYACRNNAAAVLPYPRMLTALCVRRWPHTAMFCLEERVRSIQEEYIDGLEGRENVESWSTGSEEGEDEHELVDEGRQIHEGERDDWDEGERDDADEGQRDDAEDPVDVRNGPIVDHGLLAQFGRLSTGLRRIEGRLGRMQRNQERHIRDMGYCYGLQLDRYEFSNDNEGGTNY